MTKEQAEQFLEERGFCMKHLVKPVKAKGAKRETVSGEKLAIHATAHQRERMASNDQDCIFISAAVSGISETNTFAYASDDIHRL